MCCSTMITVISRDSERRRSAISSIHADPYAFRSARRASAGAAGRGWRGRSRASCARRPTACRPSGPGAAPAGKKSSASSIALRLLCRMAPSIRFSRTDSLEDRVFLWHVAEAAADRSSAGSWPTGAPEADGSRFRRRLAEQRAQQRRLAGAIAAEHGDAAARRRRQRHVGQHLAVAIAGVQALDGEECGVRHGSCTLAGPWPSAGWTRRRPGRAPCPGRAPSAGRRCRE